MSDRRKTCSAEADGAVGYGRPPVHSQFKPGRSGNPRGRPKGSKNPATLLEAELNRYVVVTEDGVRRKRTKHEVLVKQIVNRALALKHSNDLRPLLELWKFCGMDGRARAQDIPAESALGGEDDLAILRAQLNGNEGSDDEPS